MQDFLTSTALWWAVILSGIYHGISPGMGWPLAVSAALMERRSFAIGTALGRLAIGHFLSMLAFLLPLSFMIFVVRWEAEIRLFCGFLVATAGMYLLFNLRHPRFLARIKPSNLVLWSFLAALAHGAGLMLVPIYLGICEIAPEDSGHLAASHLMRNDIALALGVAAAHTSAMTLAGALISVSVYFWLGLKFLSRAWFNLDLFWAVSLIVVGFFGIFGSA